MTAVQPEIDDSTGESQRQLGVMPGISAMTIDRGASHPCGTRP